MLDGRLIHSPSIVPGNQHQEVVLVQGAPSSVTQECQAEYQANTRTTWQRPGSTVPQITRMFGSDEYTVCILKCEPCMGKEGSVYSVKDGRIIWRPVCARCQG